VQPPELRSAGICNFARELPAGGILYHREGKSRQLVTQAGEQPNKQRRWVVKTCSRYVAVLLDQTLSLDLN